MQTRFELKSFDDFTSHELYAIMQLRIEVFSVEQQYREQQICAFMLLPSSIVRQIRG